ncbi:hypothetical protein BU26DRAFT_589552 [Trematosphaeria pertusa]|uniref:Uncharacterized protein n=1 Tax=Trematosphaeria pertusa TaxID=390896 RepID=A0A6A6HQM1_9PLEO|nr:uncharacterized protein BU26DRAFT_589552 [Trematosphaeria pertusa]KAF2240321.1 hypothetical protein BU26DRAFT_589552 [Trematosphaeria pertusa]
MAWQQIQTAGIPQKTSKATETTTYQSSRMASSSSTRATSRTCEREGRFRNACVIATAHPLCSEPNSLRASEKKRGTTRGRNAETKPPDGDQAFGLNASAVLSSAECISKVEMDEPGKVFNQRRRTASLSPSRVQNLPERRTPASLGIRAEPSDVTPGRKRGMGGEAEETRRGRSQQPLLTFGDLRISHASTNSGSWTLDSESPPSNSPPPLSRRIFLAWWRKVV